MFPGSGTNPFRIPDPGVKKVPDPGSGSATLVDSDSFFYCVSVGTTAVLSAGVYSVPYRIPDV